MHLKNNRFFSYTLLHHLRLNNLHIDHIQLPYSNDQSPVMLHFFLEKNTIFWNSLSVVLFSIVLTWVFGW